MEYTQWVLGKMLFDMGKGVLILVVMEYTQWVFILGTTESLNGLNPCCNGIYSMSWKFWIMEHMSPVLILVVMEYTQWVI